MSPLFYGYKKPPPGKPCFTCYEPTTLVALDSSDGKIAIVQFCNNCQRLIAIDN